MSLVFILVLIAAIQNHAEIIEPQNKKTFERKINTTPSYGVPYAYKINTTSSDDAPNSNKSNVILNGGPCQRKPPSAKDSVFITIFSLIFIVGVTGNIVAIVIIVLSKRLNSMPTNLFVVALAVCDIGAITFVIPIRIDNLFHSHNFCFNAHVCRMFTFTELLFHSASISHLFVIAIERFVAVNYPFVYQRVMNRTFTIMLSLYTWCYALVWACLSQFNWEDPSNRSTWFYEDSRTKLCLVRNRIYFNVSLIMVYILPLAVMGGLYLSILRVALKQARIIESLSVHRDQSVKKQRREVRATKTLAIIYGAFTVCWLPVSLISLTVQWVPHKYREFRTDFPKLSEVIFALFIEVLPTLNSSLNPFLYLFFNKKVRQEMQSYYERFRNISPTFQMDSDSSIGQVAIRSKYLGDNSKLSTNFESNSNHNQSTTKPTEEQNRQNIDELNPGRTSSVRL
ncbi:histamine H2 receptor-like [Clytia hemisphaerica]|uniref:G-protein coupled receptors family 1 profile domain-containing protein n=1 Tax=Clytia hemisphaerica TaxID=252671 RepID=A0A7M5TUL9_9CNID|eukprot:TCONS_00056553-protein